jgi:tetratricopeptide (TPR) repeat protein
MRHFVVTALILMTFAALLGSEDANHVVFAAAGADLQLEGFDYIKTRNYAKALECFSAALKEHPKSWMLMQNVGCCQMELGHYDTAIAYFQKSIEAGGLHATQCNDMAAAYQRAGQPEKALYCLKLACLIDPALASDPTTQATIRKLKDPATSPTGSPAASDYLASTTSFKGWPKSAMPLKVYVRSNYQIPNFYPEFVEIVRNSLDQWCKATANAITYQFVDNRESANLICDYTDHRELVSSQHELGIDGNTEMLVKQDNTPGKANIVILVKDAPGAPTFRKPQLLTLCCLHELGHALGMHGHSPNSHDVMFPCATLTGTAMLSERDKATIRRMYAR